MNSNTNYNIITSNDKEDTKLYKNQSFISLKKNSNKKRNFHLSFLIYYKFNCVQIYLLLIIKKQQIFSKYFYL